MTTAIINQAMLNQAANAECELGNMQENLRQEEARLTSISREVVATLGALKKAEASAKKLNGCNQAIESRLEQLREALSEMQRLETRSSGIAFSLKKNIAAFTEQHGETIRLVREYEKAMQDAGL